MLRVGGGLPNSDLGFFWVWLRNATVWKRSWKTSLVGSVGEPLMYFVGLGYGLGTLIPAVAGQPYLHFVAPGLIITSVMQSVTIEATYANFTKMEHQKIFASMLLSPLTFADIVVGELLWAMTKGLLSGGTVLVLCLLFGVGELWPGLACLGLIFWAGLIFSCLGMIVTSMARGYDFFNYYFTLVISPMFFFSGVFYPVAGLGPWAEYVAWVFPLTHLTQFSRVLLTAAGDTVWWHEALWLAGFSVFVWVAAVQRMTRRFGP